ncbi:hypothetical protein CCP4SC76_1780003 [Gammaproteobacteria bacterium]
MTTFAAGEKASFAATSDGTLWAWGANGAGQLGMATPTSRSVPFRVPNLTGVSAIATANASNLALLQDGSVWTWGENNAGQLGDGTQVDRSTPWSVEGLAPARAVAAGETHNLAVKSDGTVWAWGDNSHGQLGRGNHDGLTHAVPSQVTNLTGAVAVAARGGAQPGPQGRWDPLGLGQ